MCSNIDIATGLIAIASSMYSNSDTLVMCSNIDIASGNVQ